MPRDGGAFAEAADCQERDLLLDGGSRLVARPQPRPVWARSFLTLLACTAVAACSLAWHGGGRGGGSRGARPTLARLVPENTSSGATSYPLQVKQQRKAEKHWEGSADEVTCAMIGCGKVADAPCQCTTRCSSNGPGGNCCHDYESTCKLHAPEVGPGGTSTRQVVPGFNSEGVQCEDGPLPDIWQHDAGGASLEVRVLSYNLMWYELFHPDSDETNSATRLIAAASADRPFDLMGFQECEEEDFLMERSGLSEYYEIFRDRAICMAYRKDVWNMLSMGHAYVAADKQFGKRAVQFMRVQHKQTGRLIFFVNHHGPIPVDTGGICGGKSVAYEMLQLVKTNGQQGDAVIVLGDFNANPTSDEIVALDQKLSRDVSEKSGLGSLDHIYSNIPGSALGPAEDIGSGGSDHNALSATYKFGSGEPSAAPALDVPQWAIGDGPQDGGAAEASGDAEEQEDDADEDPEDAPIAPTQAPPIVQAAPAPAPLPPVAAPSCSQYGCGTFVAGLACQCEPTCEQAGTCCSDFITVCPAPVTTPAPAQGLARIGGLVGELLGRLKWR